MKVDMSIEDDYNKDGKVITFRFEVPNERIADGGVVLANYLLNGKHIDSAIEALIFLSNRAVAHTNFSRNSY